MSPIERRRAVMLQLARCLFGRKEPDCLLLIEIECEYSGRRKVFNVIKPSCLLFAIEKVPVPLRIVIVGSVRRRDYGWHTRLRFPYKLISPGNRLKTE